jgi:hypothetical protein
LNASIKVQNVSLCPPEDFTVYFAHLLWTTSLSIWNLPGCFVSNVETGHVIESVKNVAEIAAILVGASWTYLNYFRGRIYKRRLEPSLACNIEEDGVYHYLIIDAQIKNVGLSKIPIPQSGTALILNTSIPYEQISQPMQVSWVEEDRSSSFPVFAQHIALEPGESISEQLMIQLPQEPPFAYRAVLRIAGKPTWFVTRTLPVGEKWHNK